MNAIKQALHAMTLELLKDAGYKADVEVQDGPSAGLYAVRLSKGIYHCQFIVRSRDSLFEVTHHANLRVMEFKAYLAMKEPVAEAEALLNFFKTWIKWASGGTAHRTLLATTSATGCAMRPWAMSAGSACQNIRSRTLCRSCCVRRCRAIDLRKARIRLST